MIWGLRTAKAPLGGKMFARCIPQRRSAGLFGHIARISCQNKLYLNTWRRYVAANRCFPRPRPLRERIGAQSCHGRQSENASGRYLAMARRRMIATEVHRRPISDCNGSKPLTNRADDRAFILRMRAYSMLFSASIMLILAKVRLESCATMKANNSVRPHA